MSRMQERTFDTPKFQLINTQNEYSKSRLLIGEGALYLFYNGKVVKCNRKRIKSVKKHGKDNKKQKREKMKPHKASPLL